MVPLLNFRITYTTNSVSDWVSVYQSDKQVALELANPLLTLIRKLGRVNDLRKELEKAMKAIGVGGLIAQFNKSVAEIANSFLPVNAFAETIPLALAVYLLGKLHDTGLLMLGQIHQADIGELPRWMEFIDEAQRNSDIKVG